MAIYKYPQEVHDFVKEWAPKLRDRDLAKACNAALGTNFTAQSMKGFRGNHGYRNSRKKWTSEECWKYQTRYPQGMYEFIRDNFWGVSSAKLAEMVNERFGTSFSPSAMNQFRYRHGIRSGCLGRYQKSHEPGNKGKAGRPLMPVGAIVKKRDGSLFRKKQMEGSLRERWEPLHRAVWEEHNGPIPEGMVVSFKNGDKGDVDISNLMLLTREECLELNRSGLRFDERELTEAGLTVARLKIKTRQRKRRIKEE